MTERDAWWMVPLRAVDRTLRDVSKKARKALRILRLARFAVFLLFLVPLVAAGLTVWRPVYAPYALIVMGVYAAVPLLVLFIVMGLPLKAKSVVRLIEKGYPANVRELAIRTAARKLHEQSIETEELLLDTAINESKKALKKYRARAQKLKRELDSMPDDPEDMDEDGSGRA